MQTSFTREQLTDPAMAVSESVIRKCVHCGFCTATCPTYVLLGDELDSPRGRIYLMKEMLETQARPTAEVVKHIDRCLSCLSCMSTCPSGVNYMHLVDHARAWIEAHHDRGLVDRTLRGLVAMVLPHPRRFRLALRLAAFARPLAPLFGRVTALKPLSAMLTLAPRRLPAPVPVPVQATTSPATGSRGRVVLMQGCAEPVLSPQIRAATVRVLERSGYAVSFAAGERCCGALVHHMGREGEALAASRRNVDAWTREIEQGLVGIVITTSGCGTTIKDYGFMLRGDPDYAGRAERVSALARDVSELLVEAADADRDGAGRTARTPSPTIHRAGLVVAYHSACSMQHGQKVTIQPLRLLREAGFVVKTPAESHLCCGSAGTYNIFQSEIAGQLGDRKASQIERLKPDIIATGNIGCAVQIGRRSGTPVVHTVELLDWAAGGPVPPALANTAIIRRS
jgi:glycolate oxidase iron-sulfur subunit